MIRKGIRYAYPVALIRTLMGNLLGARDYSFLLRTRSTEDMLAHLRTTVYERAVSETREEPSSFAFALYEHFLRRSEKIIAVLPRSAQGLCRNFLLRFEIESLKVFLRAAVKQTEQTCFLSLLYPLPAASSLRFDLLLEAKGLDGISAALNGTPYARPVQEEIKQLGSAPLLFPLEMRLDRWFLMRLYNSAATFSGQERKVIERLLGTLTDVTNILWAQRLRTTFNASPEKTASLLFPCGMYLSERKRQALATWDGRGPLPFLFHGSGRTAPPSRPSLMRLLCREALKPLFAFPFQAGVPLAYLFLGEMEVADLKVLWEGKRWSIEPAELVGQLTRFHGPQVLRGNHV